MGFVTPEAAWVREEAPKQFFAEVARALEASQGILTPAVLPAAQAIICGSQAYDNTLWRWICLGRWMERHSLSL